MTYYDFVLVEYTPTGYLGSAKTTHDSVILQEEYRKKYNPDANILEISRLAPRPGSKFSTKYTRLHLLYTKPYRRMLKINIEAVYHGSKCFENGGPYEDLLSPKTTAHAAKYDKRLGDSGKLLKFHFDERNYPAYPCESAFFDWLYINALQRDSNICDVSSQLFEYDAFTDMDFNPTNQKCIVCPARVAAMYIGMTRAGVLTDPVDFKALATLDNMMLWADIYKAGYDVIMEFAPSEEKVKVILDHPPVEASIGDKIVHKTLGVGKVY